MPLLVQHRLQSQVAWVQMPALPLTGCVTLVTLPNPSLPWFPRLENENSIIYLSKLLRTHLYK